MQAEIFPCSATPWVPDPCGEGSLGAPNQVRHVDPSNYNHHKLLSCIFYVVVSASIKLEISRYGESLISRFVSDHHEKI